MARVSAEEAAQVIQQEQRALNRPYLPPTLARIQELQKSETFPICNVGPWPHLIERGSLMLVIPAYDAEKDKEKRGYACSVPFPEVFRMSKLIGGGGNEGPLEYSWIDDDGHQVARDLIGVGFGLPKNNSLVQYGVFVPEGRTPTKEEIAAANRELDLYTGVLIEEARQAYDKGRDEWGKVKTDRHLWAARRKGVHEAWVTEAHTQQSVLCKACGKFNPPGIAMCQCGTILNAELWIDIQAQQEQIREAAKPKRGER